MATATIGATGRNYTTPQGLFDDLVGTLTEQEIGDCYADDVFNITSQQTTSGINTSSTNDLILRAASTQAFYDNITAGTDALQYDSNNGVAFESSTAYLGAMFNIATVTDFTMEGLQIYVHATDCRAIGDARGTTNNIGIYLKRLIVDGEQGSGFAQIISTSGGQNDTTDWAVINTLIVCRGPASAHALRQFGRGQYVGCTIAGTAASPTNDGLVGGYTTGKGGCINCAFFGFGNPTNNAALDITNCETDATAWDATGTLTNAGTSKTYADQFEDITGGHGLEDWTTKAGSDLEGAGADEALQENIDIFGNTRTNGDFDIGCAQAPAAGGGGRIMSSLVGAGGLAGHGGLAGQGGGLAAATRSSIVLPGTLPALARVTAFPEVETRRAAQ